MKYRLEKDMAGSRRVEHNAYYGVHSLHAAENFPITGRRLPGTMIQSMAWIKKACAAANEKAGVLPPDIAQAIMKACDDVIAGRLRDQFIVDPIQGGAGTSTNMNANEVIANRAIEYLGGRMGDYSLVDPNDHVNCGQSTNDVYPTCVKMTLYQFMGGLDDALTALVEALEEKAHAFDDVVKMGRTQLQDAVPIRLGQEFAAYAAVMRREQNRLRAAREELLHINLGGTAIGTAVNAASAYLKGVVPELAAMTGIPFVRSHNLVDATQNADVFLVLSSALKGCAASLSKICNDLRMMSSGPDSGFGEITLPVRQNGSSIMPGKINPVIPEVVNQIAFRVIGFDLTVTLAVEAGQLELNAFEPVIFDSLYQSVTQLARGMETLTRRCVKGIVANRDRCLAEADRSVAQATALSPLIGYHAASQLAHESRERRIPLRLLAVEKGLLTPEEADRLLDPAAMTEPEP